MTVSESSALPTHSVAMVGTPIRAYVSVRQVVPSPMGDSIRAFTFECVLNVNIASVDSTQPRLQIVLVKPNSHKSRVSLLIVVHAVSVND